MAINKDKFIADLTALKTRALTINEKRIAINCQDVIGWFGTIDEVKTQTRAQAILDELNKKITVRERRFAK